MIGEASTLWPIGCVRHSRVRGMSFGAFGGALPGSLMATLRVLVLGMVRGLGKVAVLVPLQLILTFENF